jgi:hypothetical protein
MSTIRPSADSIATHISDTSVSLFLADATIILPQDPPGMLAVAEALQNAVRHLWLHAHAVAYRESEKAERAAARAVNARADGSPFGTVPLQRRHTDIPVGGDAA